MNDSINPTEVLIPMSTRGSRMVSVILKSYVWGRFFFFLEKKKFIDLLTDQE
jgi:hypothetical protein